MPLNRRLRFPAADHPAALEIALPYIPCCTIAFLHPCLIKVIISQLTTAANFNSCPQDRDRLHVATIKPMKIFKMGLRRAIPSWTVLWAALILPPIFFPIAMHAQIGAQTTRTIPLPRQQGNHGACSRRSATDEPSPDADGNLPGWTICCCRRRRLRHVMKRTNLE